MDTENEKRIKAVKALIRYKQEWIDGAPRWDRRRREEERLVRELKAELKGLGGTLETRKRASPKKAGKVTPLYNATHRVRHHTIGTPPDPDETIKDFPRFHEDGGDGTPLCGTPLTTWHDKDGVKHDTDWQRYGPGPVQCGSCANRTSTPVSTTYEPLEQGDSVRTVSGGAFEMNRRRH